MRKTYAIPAEQIKRLAGNIGSCYATDKITMEGAKVGTMYREAPRHEGDSGWTFFAGTETQADLDDPDQIDIYDVNTICNYDPDIIPHLDAPVNAAFEREGDTFVSVPFKPGD